MPFKFQDLQNAGYQASFRIGSGYLSTQFRQYGPRFNCYYLKLKMQ